MLLRINMASIVTAVGFVFGAAILRYAYVVWKLSREGMMTGGPSGIDTRLLFTHPLIYAVIVFVAGLYIGGRIFHR